MPAAPRRSDGEITQSPHRSRRRSGVQGLYGPGVVTLIGAVVIAASLIDSQQSVIGLIVGALILIVGLVMLAGGLPGIGQWRAAHARVRSTPEGIVFEGEVADTTVPWEEFQALVPEWHGSRLVVWLVRSGGQRFPVPTLSRHGLLTEGARARALAEVERVNAELAGRRSGAARAHPETTAD